MVASAKRRKITEFVCAAGVLAHYVGDACQPLHISAMFDGDPDDPSPDGDKPRARGVHSAYETSMLNKNFDALLSSINEATKQKSKRPARVSGGHGAAVAVVDLMRETFETLSPAKIIEAYVDDKDLWEEFQKQTVRLIVRGALTLAVLWESAWKEGLQGREVEDGALEAVSMEDLTDLYQDPDFLPSMTLDELAKVLPSPSA
jgi:hypothetical protein